MRASRMILRPAAAVIRVPSMRCSRVATRTTRPSTPASAIRRLVPAPSRKYGIPRSRAPSSTFSMPSAFAGSMKKSAGPPMPKEVCEASGSFSLTAGSPRNHATLDALRQLIAQLTDIARTHQKEDVVTSDHAFQHLARALEITNVRTVGQEVGQVARLHARRIVLAGRVDVEHQHFVRARESSREVLHEGRQARVTVRLEHHDHAAVAELACRLERRAHLG